MAEPIRLGTVIDDPEDVREFEEHMKRKPTKKEIEFFKEAIKVYEEHHKRGEI